MKNAERPIFEEPWEAKAFAITVALHERGVFTWSEWADMFSARIADTEALGETDADGYYRNWLEALEDLLVVKGVSTTGETARWREAWRRAAVRTPHGTPIEVQTDDF